MGLGPPGGYWLNVFGSGILQAWGHTAYHVGSSLTKKHGWRDVDVRLLIPDEEYDQLFLPKPDWGQTNWFQTKMHEIAWSEYGKKLTDLPIDFQIQRMTDANEAFTGPRGALLLMDRDMPTVRTSQ